MNDPQQTLQKPRAARLILTVSPGRSGTRLLARLLSDRGRRVLNTAMHELTSLDGVRPLGQFVAGTEDFRIDPETFHAVVSLNQNPRERFRTGPGAGKILGNGDPEDQEHAVDAALARL